jgi:hypothetical protein
MGTSLHDQQSAVCLLNNGKTHLSNGKKLLEQVSVTGLVDYALQGIHSQKKEERGERGPLGNTTPTMELFS